MGNVSSSDHDKVNNRLTRKVKKKAGSSSRKKQRKQQEDGQQSFEQPQSPDQKPSKGVDSFEGQDDRVLNPHGSFHVHRQAPSPRSISRVPRPFQGDGLTLNRISASQFEFYTKSKAEYSPLTPTSPTTAYSVTSSTTLTSTHSQIHDPHAVPNSPSAQELPSPVYLSSPIAIPQQLLIQGSDHGYTKHEDTNSPDTCLTDTSMSLAADFDHHAHYWQQQKQLSADLHLLGTSPEAKQWLKQKPTRSNTRLIHQYNFQSQQYYQPPGSVKLVCSTTRSKSVSSCPSSSGINHDPSTNSNISCPDSAPVSPVDTRSRFDSTVACGTNITLPQQQQAMDPGLANVDDVASNGSSPAISRDLDQDHSDGHFYGHEQGVSSHISEGQSRKQKPRVGRLVMSRSKIPNPVITSVASLTSMDSNESSRCQGPGRHA